MAPAANALLNRAVHQNAAWDLTGLQERLFTSWFGGFFYNQIWEDPRVDLAGLQLNGTSRVLTISSAGCNVLNYLTARPRAITAIDLNPHHIYLTRLKVAALRHLPSYEDFFQFFGCANSPGNLENYTRYLRDTLDEATRNFWEGGSWLRRRVMGPRIEYFCRNLYDYARLGYFLRVLHWLARHCRHDPSRLLQARDTAEQTQIYETYIKPVFDHWLFQAIGRLPFTLFGIGIPPRQVEALRAESNGQLMTVIEARVRRLACAHPVRDNYFSWQAFGRQYDREKREAVPDYLKPEHFETLRRQADTVTTRIDSLHRFLTTQEAGAYDRFVFLDAQDWMEPEAIAALWSEVIRVGGNGARAIFRTAGSASPVEHCLPADLRRRLTYQEKASHRLFAQDRAAIYGGFHIYQVQG